MAAWHLSSVFAEPPLLRRNQQHHDSRFLGVTADEVRDNLIISNLSGS